jgi:hypothetical protein
MRDFYNCVRCSACRAKATSEAAMRRHIERRASRDAGHRALLDKLQALNHSYSTLVIVTKVLG